ncbi:hypothetical protein [Pelagibius sp. Alg239-R121]|nr:hypothetical protein [Pelagibius sp. Alg239-R121]
MKVLDVRLSHTCEFSEDAGKGFNLNFRLLPGTGYPAGVMRSLVP